MHSAYSARAHEYIDLLGNIDTTAPEGRAMVTLWARGCTGRVVDIGCGPGNWTAYLAGLGVTAEGIDPVPEFIDHAQRTYPTVPLRQGTVDDSSNLPYPLGGVFSWYSLIHLDPTDVPEALAKIRAVQVRTTTYVLGLQTGAYPSTDSEKGMNRRLVKTIESIACGLGNP